MALVITGVHRSGASAVASWLEAWGTGITGASDAPNQASAGAFVQCQNVVDVNDRWLARLGGRWWTPPATSADTWQRLGAGHLDASRTSLDLFEPGPRGWYAKDPRISLLLPLWDRLALRTLPTVLVVRDPRPTVMGLHLREGISPRHGLTLWFAYLGEVVSQSFDRDVLVLDYEALVDGPQHAATVLDEFVHTAFEHAHPGPARASIDWTIGARNRTRWSSLPGISARELDEALDAHRHLAKFHAQLDCTFPESMALPAWVLDTLEQLRSANRLEQRSLAHTESIDSLGRGHGDQVPSHAPSSIHPNRWLAPAPPEPRQGLGERDLRHELRDVRRELNQEREMALSLLAELQRRHPFAVPPGHDEAAAVGTTPPLARLGELQAALLHEVSELAALRDRLSGEVRSQAFLADRRSEALDALTATLERVRAQAHAGGLASQRVQVLEAELMAETARLVRLRDALEGTLSDGQGLIAQLRALRRSRSLRIGRRVTWLYRAFNARFMGQPMIDLHASGDDRSQPGRRRSILVADVDPADLTAIEESGLFEGSWYAEHNIDVVESGIDPWEHFTSQGWREGRSPGPMFDLAWYVHTYQAEIPAGVNPLAFYLADGWKRGHLPLSGMGSGLEHP